MKLIKTYLRNRAEDDCLIDLTVLFAHKNRLVDRAKLIETFAEPLDRRVGDFSFTRHFETNQNVNVN